VAAGAADLHRASTHRAHHPVAAAQASASAAPVAIGQGSAQPRSATFTRHTAATPRKTASHHHNTATQHTSGSSSPSATSPLPATRAGSGTFPDTPPPATADRPAGHENPATDPAKQPIGAPEPVQVQGFDPQQPSGDGSADSGSGTATSP